jgi:hypothetical protein
MSTHLYIVYLYKGEFSILDPQSNKWVSGFIQPDLKWKGDLYTIGWGENHLTMKKEFGSLTNIFRDSDGGEILAEFQRRPTSIF